MEKVYNVLCKFTQSVIAAVRMLFAFSSTLVVSSSYTAVARNKVHDVDLQINKHAVGFRDQTFPLPPRTYAPPLPSPKNCHRGYLPPDQVSLLRVTIGVIILG